MKWITPLKAIYSAILLGTAFACAWGQGTGRAAINPQDQRQSAPNFRLRDASGKEVRLSDYHGQVVLLDFWATACGGCRIEIPWYVEFESTYGHKGLAVVGVSMDMSYEDLKSVTEAWSVVLPFAAEQKINYPILMADDQTTKDFAIEGLPATFLIDDKGRVAATYRAVLADKNNVEQNIQTLFAERNKP